MFKTTFLAGLAVLALSACNDASNGVTAPDSKVAYGRSPTPTANPNGPTWMLGDFHLDITLSAGDAGVNKHPQGKGRCGDPNNGEDPTVWYAPGNPEQATGAPFCQDSGSGQIITVLCTIDPQGLPATYAFGTGGQGIPADDQTANNENINAHSNLIPQDTAQFVHYAAPTKKGQKGVTLAKSETAFTFSCTDGTVGDAFISLDAFNNYAGNLFTGLGVGDRRLKVESIDAVDVRMYASGDGPYTQGAVVGIGQLDSLYWFFRSRFI